MDRIYRVRDGRYALERHGHLFWLEGDVFGSYEAGDEITQRGLQFAAPVQPSKIMAIGLNYKDHAAEMNKTLPEEPLVFMKPSTAVVGPEHPVSIPLWAGRIDHEELIFPVPELVSFVSRFCPLEPGDIISTGTPSGVGPLTPGDRVMIKVEGVGALGNPCVEA